MIVGPDVPEPGSFVVDEGELWLLAWKAGQYVAEGRTPREAATQLLADLMWLSVLHDLEESA